MKTCDPDFVAPRSKYSKIRTTIDDSSPRLKFNKTFYEMSQGFRGTAPWGQRKLLLSEISTISKIKTIDPSVKTIVYVGAGPGNHIKFLSSLYKEYKFILYDPVGFVFKDNIPNVETHAECFTDEIAKKYATADSSPAPILFISDIRLRTDSKTPDPEPCAFIEKYFSLMKDNELQERWIRIINPRMASLKFRLPWGTAYDIIRIIRGMGPRLMMTFDYEKCELGKPCDNPMHGDHTQYLREYQETEEDLADKNKYWDMVKEMCEKLGPFGYNYEYLDGTVLLQPWAPVDSSETRLFINNTASNPSLIASKVYDSMKYEEQLYFHNNFMRTATYGPPSCRFCGCFDCMLEISILSNLLKTNDPVAIHNLSMSLDLKISPKYPRNIYTIVDREERRTSLLKILERRVELPQEIKDQYHYQ